MISPRAITLVPPCGGQLIDLVVPAEERDEVWAWANRLPSIQISERAVDDLELLATGGFSPLDRFMGFEDYRRVLDEMRLATGYIFPIPVTLPVHPGAPIHLDRPIALRSPKNDLLAVMTVEEIYEWDRAEVACKVLGTQDLRHPLVAEMDRWGQLNVSGPLRVLQLPRHYDFQALRLSPLETRARLERLGRANVVAFETSESLQRIHEAFLTRVVREVDGTLLLLPTVGMRRAGDVHHYARIRTYKAMANAFYDPERILLALLPLATRMAGPREALWQTLIRRNYGANYSVIERDHASPGLDSTGRPFFGVQEAQALVESFRDELGIVPVPLEEYVYLPDENCYEKASKVPSTKRTVSISTREVHEKYLKDGWTLPDWFTRPEVAEILAEAHPPRYRQGVCLWFTGLSGSGKSTTAEILTDLLLEHGRQVTLLDGDVVRTHLSKGLGFSREDRDINIRRIGFVASEIVRHGGVAICAAVSPYRAARNDARNMIGGDRFIEIYVNTPLEVCEARDVKGMYAKARRGEIKGLTGIDDPYEPPQTPEITLDTVSRTSEENARLVLDFLIERGFVRREELSVASQGVHRETAQLSPYSERPAAPLLDERVDLRV